MNGTTNGSSSSSGFYRKKHHKNSSQITEYFSDQITIVLHFGDKKADFKASSLSRMNSTRGQKGHLFERQRWTGAAQALIESTDYVEKVEEFIDQLDRISEKVAIKHHPLRSMADYSDYYHILADVVAQTLIENRVETVLFFNVPHLTYDLILYQTAQSLGINTLIVTQSIFPDTFWSMCEVKNMGNFNIARDAPRYEINKDEALDLFYMRGIKQQTEQGGSVSVMGWIHLFVFLARKRPLQAFNPHYVLISLKLGRYTENYLSGEIRLRNFFTKILYGILIILWALRANLMILDKILFIFLCSCQK